MSHFFYFGGTEVEAVLPHLPISHHSTWILQDTTYAADDNGSIFSTQRHIAIR
jgi:hypothetical protein